MNQTEQLCMINNYPTKYRRSPLPEEVAGNVQLFTPNNCNFVSVQQDLSNDCGQTAEEMATAIDNYGLKHRKHQVIHRNSTPA